MARPLIYADVDAVSRRLLFSSLHSPSLIKDLLIYQALHSIGAYHKPASCLSTLTKVLLPMASPILKARNKHCALVKDRHPDPCSSFARGLCLGFQRLLFIDLRESLRVGAGYLGSV